MSPFVYHSPLAADQDMHEAMEDILVDISQSHGRRPHSNAHGIAHTLTTSSLLYSFKHRTVLTPFQHLLLQGYPGTVAVSSSHSDRDVRAMAGEAIALPCLGLLVWALFLLKGFSV